jgi:arylsulfatase A-like enzyme
LDRRADGNEPFFCVLSVQPPHNPYVAPERWHAQHTGGQIQLRPNVPDIPRVTQRARRELAGYYAMIENLDWNLGRLRDRLRDRGMIEHTHLIFFSDHGDMHGSQGQFLKTNPYEESVRVPCIFGGMTPNYGGKNGSTPFPINHVDYAPTSLGLCGITPPRDMVGTDYSALRMRGVTPGELPDSAYMQLVKPTKHGNSTDRPWRGIVTTDGWKYVCLEHQPWLMFNLNEDPYEQANLAHNTMYAGKRSELQNRLQRWIDDTDDNFPLPDLSR